MSAGVKVADHFVKFSQLEYRRRVFWVEAIVYGLKKVDAFVLDHSILIFTFWFVR
jgi:hypothetical protein